MNLIIYENKIPDKQFKRLPKNMEWEWHTDKNGKNGKWVAIVIAVPHQSHWAFHREWRVEEIEKAIPDANDDYVKNMNDCIDENYFLGYTQDGFKRKHRR